MYKKPTVTTQLDNKESWIRAGSVLVREGIGKNLFDLPEKNAELMLRCSNTIYRTFYNGYESKDPFGGYWFGSSTKFTYYKCSDAKYEEIMKIMEAIDLKNNISDK